MAAKGNIEDVQTRLASAQRVVVLTGAGISTESGIPDFRGPQGLWTKDPEAEKLSSLSHYMGDKDVRRRAWQARMRHEAFRAHPNAGHLALVTLEQTGKLDTLITQNIDGLHQRAGNSPERIVEIHGTVHEVVCMSCADRTRMLEALDRVRAGEDDPACLRCGGILKSATISFGQALVDADLRRAFEAAAGCDLFLAAGSSLGVYPIASTVPLAKRNGAHVVIVNGEKTAMDEIADAMLLGSLGDLLPALVQGLARHH